MPKPEAGKIYTVVKGDRLRAIARRAYGYDRSSDVISSNYELLKNRAISLEGLPTIYPADQLFLPAIKKELSEKVPSQTDDEITIRIDGKNFTGWTASNITRNINTVADAFTFSFPYDPNNTDQREKTKPFSYLDTDLFIGGELYIAGQSLKWSPSVRKDSTEKTVDVRTKAGHTIECMAQKEAVEYNGETLAFIATDILKSYGDNLKPVFFDGDSDAFTKVRKEITDTDFDFLSGLAVQKGFMITSSDDGQMAFIRANTTGLPVFRFIEGTTAMEHVSATYDGQKRHSEYMALTDSAGVSAPSSVLRDSSIPIYRPFAFTADDLEAGNLDTALQWKKSKSLADSVTISITVTGWRNENNQLWRENMIGTVQIPSVDIFTETAYIISGVNLTKDENGGNKSMLTMVLPQAYTLEFPSSFPWE